MAVVFSRELESLHRRLMSMSATVEEMIDKAAIALVQRDLAVALDVIETDEYVDQQEVGIEEECLKLIALHQPVAADLRRLTTVLKVNNDLERIADLAVNIAERSRALDAYPSFMLPASMNQIADLVSTMVRDGLNGLVNLDSEAARGIIALDDEVDELNVRIIQELKDQMRAAPDNVSPGLHSFSASRHFERIGDHATNIAEEVIYLVEGEIVRHRHEGESSNH